MREWSSGATRDDEEGKLDFEGFLSPEVLRRFAEYMHEHRKQADGKLRASDNWQNGIPQEAYMKSLARHFFDVWWKWDKYDSSGKAWEDALCAMLFNLQGLLFETLQAGKGSMRREVPSPDTASYTYKMGGGSLVGYDAVSAAGLDFEPNAFSDAFDRFGVVSKKGGE